MDASEVEFECKCLQITGHLHAVKWLLWHRDYHPSAGPLALGDWVQDPFIWLHYVESSDGVLATENVLLNTATRYWDIHDVQRYFVGGLHCEQVLFTYQYPDLRMPTPLGIHNWKANTALKLPSTTYQKEFHRSFEETLKKMESTEAQMDRLIISDQLIKIDRLDHFKRLSFFRILLNLLSFQDRLQLVSFENLCCKRLEGVRLIQQLACFNADTLKYLFLWRFVLPNENPLLINYSYITGKSSHPEVLPNLSRTIGIPRCFENPLGRYEVHLIGFVVIGSGQYIPRPKTRHCFLRSLGELRNLQVLALEYSHIADGTGGALISLLPVIKRPHFRLQLICREDQIPGRADAALGTGGYGIPDTAWRRVTIACPDIYVLMVFFKIRDYDNVRRFLTPSIPLHETRLQLGIDLKMRQRQDSDVSCFVRHIAYQYANTLVTFSIHQWRFATFPLRRVFELMPHLVRFFYVGRVEDDVDLRRMLQIVACGVCDKLKQIKVQIQDDEDKKVYWQNVFKNLVKEYSDIMQLYDINFCIGIYKN